MGFQIIGTGYHLPGEPVSNAELIERTGIDSTSEWILQRTGIEQRYFVGEDMKEPNAQIASQAGLAALKNAGIEDPVNAGIDAVIVATCTPDNLFPSVASGVADRMGIDPKYPPLDVNAACSGFSAALELTHGLYETGRYERIMVIGSEVFSRIMDAKDRGTVILFGDGAGAWLTEKTSGDYGLIGTASRFLYDKDSLNYANPWLSVNKPKIEMNGSEVYRMVAKNLGALLRATLADAKLEPEEVDMVIPHQANLRLIEAGEKGAGIPQDKILRNGVINSGNTSGASIPIAAALAKENGAELEGNVVILGFGAGMILHGGALRLPKSA